MLLLGAGEVVVTWWDTGEVVVTWWGAGGAVVGCRW